MDPNTIALSSLSMDLRRGAMGAHRGSEKMARRFLLEAKKRASEVRREFVRPYIANILDQVTSFSESRLDKSGAEDMLLYSILLQNAVTKMH